MNTAKLLVAGLFALLLSVPAWSAEGNGTRVAVVDLQAAVMRTDMAREQMKELESQREFAETQIKLESLKKQIMEKQEEAKKEGPTWTQDQWIAHRKSVEFLRKDFELAGQKIQAESQVVLRNIEKELGPKVQDVLKQLIDAERIDIVIEKNFTVYSSADIDLTVQLTDKLNEHGK